MERWILVQGEVYRTSTADHGEVAPRSTACRLTKHNVLAVQKVALCASNEKLASIGIGARVCLIGDGWSGRELGGWGGRGGVEAL